MTKDGAITTDFGGDMDGAASVVLQTDGKIVVAGYSNNGTNNGNDVSFALARYNANGSLDGSFSGDGKLTTAIQLGDFGGSVLLQADGKIVVAGSSFNSRVDNDFAVVRYNSDGSLDTSFSGDGIVTTDIGSD